MHNRIIFYNYFFVTGICFVVNSCSNRKMYQELRASLRFTGHSENYEDSLRLLQETKNKLQDGKLSTTKLGLTLNDIDYLQSEVLRIIDYNTRQDLKHQYRDRNWPLSTEELWSLVQSIRKSYPEYYTRQTEHTVFMNELIEHIATAFDVDDHGVRDALTKSVEHSLGIDARKSRPDSSPTYVHKWCVETWNAADHDIRPPTPADPTIHFLVSRYFNIDIEEAKDLYFSGFLKNIGADERLVDTKDAKVDAIEVYGWCQDEWSRRELQGNSVSENTNEMYYIAATHFNISMPLAKSLYYEGAMKFYGFD